MATAGLVGRGLAGRRASGGISRAAAGHGARQAAGGVLQASRRGSVGARANRTASLHSMPRTGNRSLGNRAAGQFEGTRARNADTAARIAGRGPRGGGGRRSTVRRSVPAPSARRRRGGALPAMNRTLRSPQASALRTGLGITGAASGAMRGAGRAARSTGRGALKYGAFYGGAGVGMGVGVGAAGAYSLGRRPTSGPGVY